MNGQREQAMNAADETAKRRSWLGRLVGGLAKSSARLSQGIAGLLSGRMLDEAAYGELEELLIFADLGPATAAKLTDALRSEKLAADTPPEILRARLADLIAAILRPVARVLTFAPIHRPHVVLVCGVNGSGKTTTIGKLAKSLSDDGKRVVIAAGDTFRAAAVEQLKIWGARARATVIAGPKGGEAAALAYRALEIARRENADVLLIDTAGRLHNRADLMAELQKIVRVVAKLDPSAPHTTLLVLDATTGQNAQSQVEVFRDMVQVNGLIVTKLDGSARGGVVVALADRFGLPIHAVGVGEGTDDLRPFQAEAFARGLLGLTHSEEG